MDFDNHHRLHLGARGKKFGLARRFRKESTEAEDLLWQELRSRKINGLKFRRQHPISKFIADFYCHEKRLIIEVDGESHDGKEEHDKGRTFELEEHCLNVIRFSNRDIFTDLDRVLNQIREITNNLK